MPSARPEDILLLAMDVDGVLTDGAIYVDADGRELKRFHVRDGFALVSWHKAGFRSALISGRDCPAVACRARDLKIAHVMQGVRDKVASLRALEIDAGVPAARIAFLGDDLPDLAVMGAVGYPMAVADAEQKVRDAARFVTARAGGNGAVRDAIEHLLMARGVGLDAG